MGRHHPATGRRPEIRETTFGSGVGIIGFYLDEGAQQIRIFDIVWAG